MKMLSPVKGLVEVQPGARHEQERGFHRLGGRLAEQAHDGENAVVDMDPVDAQRNLELHASTLGSGGRLGMPGPLLGGDRPVGLERDELGRLPGSLGEDVAVAVAMGEGPRDITEGRGHGAAVAADGLGPRTEAAFAAELDRVAVTSAGNAFEGPEAQGGGLDSGRGRPGGGADGGGHDDRERCQSAARSCRKGSCVGSHGCLLRCRGLRGWSNDPRLELTGHPENCRS